MGMDVYGKNPTKEVGEYFRASVWGWHPLWGYVQDRFSYIADEVQYGHSNDGDGLDNAKSKQLAALLRADIADGTAARYIQERMDAIAALPMRECYCCNGTGTRTDWPDGITDDWIDQCNGCNGCQGTGKLAPIEANYGLDIETIQRFADFLDECGGFEIW